MVAATKAEPETSTQLGDWMKWEDVIRELRVSESTIRRWQAENGFPRPKRIGPRTVRFSATEIREWLQNIYDAIGGEDAAED